MVSAISSRDTDALLKKLAPAFQTSITAILDAESQPLNFTKTQRDGIDVRRGVYKDVKTNLDALQKAVQALISTQASYNLKLIAKATITPGTTGSTVLTATTTDTAAAADYDFSEIQLARAHSQVASMPAGTTADKALGFNGTYWLGGSGNLATVDGFSASTSVTDVVAANVGSGQRELGEGAYSVEVRDSGLTRQFRLVNADGDPVSMRKTDGSGYTTDWQTVTSGALDTGRGLVITLDTAGSPGSTDLSYHAKGVSIDIGIADTLRTIANKINAVIQPEGHDFRASLVSGKLVLTGAQTGENHGLLYSDALKTALNFGDVAGQTARNATFKVNGLSVSRARNSGLTDVVDGGTINLAPDAEGKTARLSIAGTADQATKAVNTLVSSFNAAFTHLTQKMAITSSTSGNKTSYTRGPLAGDTVFSSLRTDLFNRMNRSYANSGSFKRLEDIGLSIDKDLKLTFDSTKFSDAIKNHAADTTAMLDAAMGQFNTMLSGFAGTTGTLQYTLNSMDDQLKGFDQRINRYNDGLAMRKQSLVDQYLQMQQQLANLANQAQMFGIDLSG